MTKGAWMKSVLIFLIFSSLLSCGAKKKSHVSTESISVSQNASLSDYTKNLQLDLETPDGVGTLLTLKNDTYGDTSIGLCTWFLIGADIALTNSHCIPNHLKDESSSCKDSLQGAIKTSQGTEIVSCKKVLYFSELSKKTGSNNDYALLKLDRKLDRSNFFKFVRAGVEENQKVKIHTMNHAEVSGVIFSKYIQHSCIVKSSEFLGRISSIGSSPVVGFAEKGTNDICHTIQGNSGSPVLNDNDEVVGILHAGVTEGINFQQTSPSNETTNNISILRISCV
jgi:hypothetical protein